jgi:ABC-type molybdate transport system substrate-binding protein
VVAWGGGSVEPAQRVRSGQPVEVFAEDARALARQVERTLKITLACVAAAADLCANSVRTV